MAWSQATDPDYDAGWEGSPERKPKLGKLPKLPFIGLPSMGFPLLPSFDFDFGIVFSTPKFVSDLKEDAQQTALAALVSKYDLFVDLDYDLDVNELKAEIRKAAGEAGETIVAQVERGISVAGEMDPSRMIEPPRLPFIGLPSMGFPLLPSFDFDFGLVFSTPKFVSDLKEDAQQTALAALVSKYDLFVDLDYDLDVNELKAEIRKAAGEAGEAIVAQVERGISTVDEMDPSRMIEPPRLPFIGLPSMGFPLLPSFDFDFGFKGHDPLAKLAAWLED